jgi:hypothetical protein
MAFPKSSHNCMGAGAAANGFNLAVMIISFLRTISEDMTEWIGNVRHMAKILAIVAGRGTPERVAAPTGATRQRGRAAT